MTADDDRSLPAGRRGGGEGGPRLRTDIVEVYVFTRPSRLEPSAAPIAFLQLFRAAEPLRGTWQPVMGHAEPGETAARCALRELEEETGLARDGPQLLGFWALEEVHPYFVAPLDAVVLSARFAAEAPHPWTPALDPEHTAFRWVRSDETALFMWPGQRAACREIERSLLPEESLSREHLRIDPRSVRRS